MSLVAIAGDNATTTTLALAAAWPVSDDVLVVEADPRGGSLASWLDIPVAPSLSAVVTRATDGEWPVIERLSRLTPSGLRVIPAPVRAVEAKRAVAEASGSVFPTLESLASPVVIADTGPLGGAAFGSVVAQSTFTLVVHRQAQQSARAAAVRLERLAENFEQLTAGAVETALAVIGRAPFDADEIAGFVGAGAVVPPTVFDLADDPLAAAVLAGRSGVSRRRLLRLPLLRSSEAVAAFVSNRLTELAAIDRRRVDP